MTPEAGTAPLAGVEEMLAARRVVVCCGSGGVGKTTASAALGLAAARRGRRVLVCTIDPARRLANSLGLDSLGGEERRVDEAMLESAGVALAPGGSLDVMMLDIKRTFDRLIERYAPSEEHARRILENHVYRKFSGQLAGSQEYMSMEKLYELHESGRFDLVVLDTPPTKHALDFLSAPRRLSEFLDGSVLQWFVAPYFSAGRLGAAIVQAVAKRALDVLDSLFGLETLKELSEFFRAFEALWGGFQERARAVAALMARADTTAFVVVTSPTRGTVAEARYFLEKLREASMPVAGIVANRVHTDFVAGGDGASIEPGPLARAAGDEDALGFLLAEAGEALREDPVLARAARKAIENFREFQLLAEADRAHLDPLAADARAAGLFWREVPALERDVHDVAGLAALERWLVRGA